MKTTMKRSVEGRVRYYTFELIPNLFGEWVLLRTYGSMKRLKPTGIKSEVFSAVADAVESMESLICRKKKKGYV